VGACLLGVSLIFTGCGGSTDSVNLNAPSTFHGTWKDANNDEIKITADEFKIKPADNQSFYTFEDAINDEEYRSDMVGSLLGKPKMISEPEYLQADAGILVAWGYENTYTLRGVSASASSCFTRYYLLDADDSDQIKMYQNVTKLYDTVNKCKVANFSEFSSSTPTMYTKVTDDSGDSN